MGQGVQLISPQTAYIMSDMLQRVTRVGTLSYAAQSGTVLSYATPDGKKYTIPIAGKTGTTQNWADAWTVGFSPYMTTAVWFGFDTPGNSLGTTQTGAIIAGTAWADFMKEAHRGLEPRDFVRPQTGLVEAEVCALSGQLPGDFCTDGTERMIFLEGTQPREICSYHSYSTTQAQSGLDIIQGTLGGTLGGPLPSSGSLLQFDDAMSGGASPAPKPSPKASAGGLDFSPGPPGLGLHRESSLALSLCERAEKGVS
jgi:penicillin-binding protein 1A